VMVFTIIMIKDNNKNIGRNNRGRILGGNRGRILKRPSIRKTTYQADTEPGGTTVSNSGIAPELRSVRTYPHKSATFGEKSICFSGKVARSKTKRDQSYIICPSIHPVHFMHSPNAHLYPVRTIFCTQVKKHGGWVKGSCWSCINKLTTLTGHAFSYSSHRSRPSSFLLSSAALINPSPSHRQHHDAGMGHLPPRGTRGHGGFIPACPYGDDLRRLAQRSRRAPGAPPLGH
jgi:hypothetical protein